MGEPAYRRILLKISGESLSGENEFGIDFDHCGNMARMLAGAHEMGVSLAVVIGAGNIWRGVNRDEGFDPVQADYMGMLATVINSLALQTTLEMHGVPTRVQSAIRMDRVAEPFIRRRAIRHLEKGRVVIFGAGTGNPYFTTDTAAALRAIEINADAVFKATKVDGVYSADPKKDPTAVRYTHLTYQDVLNQRLRVMDTTSIALCMENRLPIVVFNMSEPENLKRLLSGEDIGTVIRAGDGPED